MFYDQAKLFEKRSHNIITTKESKKVNDDSMTERIKLC